MLAWAGNSHEDAAHRASPTSPVVDIIDGGGQGAQLPQNRAPMEQKEEGALAGCLGEPAATVVRPAVEEGVRRTAPERPGAAATVPEDQRP